MRGHRLAGFLICLFFAGCARRELLRSPYASPGRYRVRIVEEEWFDAARSRTVPVRMYVPVGVSRPFVVRLIDKAVLPARMVGSQRRLPLADVLAYKADNRARRRETLREMTALDQQLGIL